MSARSRAHPWWGPCLDLYDAGVIVREVYYGRRPGNNPRLVIGEPGRLAVYALNVLASGMSWCSYTRLV